MVVRCIVWTTQPCGARGRLLLWKDSREPVGSLRGPSSLWAFSLGDRVQADDLTARPSPRQWVLMAGGSFTGF